MPWKIDYIIIIIFYTWVRCPKERLGSTCTRSKPHPHNAYDQGPNHHKLNMEVGPAHCLLTFHAFLWFWIFPPPLLILVAEEWWNYQRIDYLVLVRMHCNLRAIFQLVIVVVVTGIDLKKNTYIHRYLSNWNYLFFL